MVKWWMAVSFSLYVRIWLVKWWMVVSFDLYVRIWLSGESGAVGVGGRRGGEGART